MEIGIGPGHIVLDGAQQPPLFGPCLLWPNGRLSQQLLSCNVVNKCQYITYLYLLQRYKYQLSLTNSRCITANVQEDAQCYKLATELS